MNEFKILNNIGHGSFSKVKKVIRVWADHEDKSQEEKMFAMKVCTRPTLELSRSLKPTSQFLDFYTYFCLFVDDA